MLLSLVLFAAGLVVLVTGADALVAGASSLAKRAGISDLVIGLTIVAFGTSMPEFMVSFVAAWQGDAALCTGNVIGSNIANILLIVGVAAVIHPLFAARGTVWKEIPFMLLATVVFCAQASDTWLNGDPASEITRSDGVSLVALFAIFLVYLWQVAFATGEAGPETAAAPGKLGLSIVKTAAGLGGLVFGGWLIVQSAVDIALTLGVSERIVGLTIVAIGTSLPELATSAVAAWRKNPSIAVGNVVGSNVFNILFVLGFSSMVTPLPMGEGSEGDLAVMLAAAGLLFVAMFIGKPNHEVQRVEGGIMLGLYVAYMAWLVASAAA